MSTISYSKWFMLLVVWNRAIVQDDSVNWDEPKLFSERSGKIEWLNEHYFSMLRDLPWMQLAHSFSSSSSFLSSLAWCYISLNESLLIPGIHLLFYTRCSRNFAKTMTMYFGEICENKRVTRLSKIRRSVYVIFREYLENFPREIFKRNGDYSCQIGLHTLLSLRENRHLFFNFIFERQIKSSLDRSFSFFFLFFSIITFHPRGNRNSKYLDLSVISIYSYHVRIDLFYQKWQLLRKYSVPGEMHFSLIDWYILSIYLFNNFDSRQILSIIFIYQTILCQFFR